MRRIVDLSQEVCAAAADASRIPGADVRPAGRRPGRRRASLTSGNDRGRSATLDADQLPTPIIGRGAAESEWDAAAGEPVAEVSVGRLELAATPRAKDVTWTAIMLEVLDPTPPAIDPLARLDTSRPLAAAAGMHAPDPRFLTPAIALDFTGLVAPREEIPLALLEAQLAAHGLEPPRGGTFLFTAGHRARTFPGPAYRTQHPGLSREAAEFLYRGAGVVNIGHDAPSIDAACNTSAGRFPCRALARELGRQTTEHLTAIGKVAGRRFTYTALPLRRRRGGSGAPIRAAAILDE